MTYRDSRTPELRRIQGRLFQLRAKPNEFSPAEEAEARRLQREEIAELRRSGSGSGRQLATAGTRSRSNDYAADSFREPRSAQDYRGSGSDPWDLTELRTHNREPGKTAAEYRSRALSCVGRMPGTNDAVRSVSTSILEKFDTRDSRLARQAIVTSRPAYLRAWSKLMSGKPHSLTVDEQRALADVDEYRAMSLTDVQGGYLVPWQLDSTLIITSTFVRSDLRSAARVVIATGDVWNGVSAQNVVWSFQPEAAETADAAPPFGQPSIPTWMARGFVPISIEAMADEANVAQAIGELLANGKQDLEAIKFIQGSGLNEPTGIITALGISGNAGSTVQTVSAGTFALADLYSLQGSLPAHYRPNASWLANNLIYNKIRQFDTAGGAGFWTNLTTDRPPQLYNRDALEAEAMSSVVATTSPKSQILLFGDLRCFYIVDRIGQTTELIPHLFSTSHNRPIGQRGFFSYFRVGSDLVIGGLGSGLLGRR